MRGWLIVKFLGDLTSLCNMSHEIARHYQNSIFQNCKPAVYTRLGVYHDGNGTFIKLHATQSL